MLAVGTLVSATTTSARPKHHTTPASSHKTSTTKTHHATHSINTSAHSSKRHGKRVVRTSWKSKGQHGIASDRTRQIQEALIQQHYLDGEANGVWDIRTQEACRKYQADNGWQSKVLPDSRALIKLGLGPDHKDVLNPETAATSPYLPGGGLKSDAIPPATTASVPQPEQ
jgi:peptidoglycan hydrolase-like protein with peptidoglycan-binding domain